MYRFIDFDIVKMYNIVNYELILTLIIWGDEMIFSVFVIGISLTAVMVVLAFVLTRASFKGDFTVYYPFLGLGAIGLFLLLFATITEKTEFLGAGLGGWGIACLFATAVGLIITSILDANAHHA